MMVMVELKASLRAGFVVARDVTRVDGDEGDRRGSAGEDVVQEVGI